MDDQDQLVRLLAMTAAGDQQAFRQLYSQSSPHLFGLLMRILKRRDWVEDVLQDSYLRIWQKAETYDVKKGVPMAWLATIARYRALDLLRIKRPEVEMPDVDDEPPLMMADSSESPENRAIEIEGMDQIESCIKSLMNEERKSVLMAYYQGYSHQELASQLNVPLGTAKSWVRRGLQKLRKCLET